ncbi:hypothetical protein BDF20DRAFT_860506 [Mycotypha africana]|uniref:uncharacterized protein n=1 Tax=Mycotypha africana TaxID=64632 RepID=UPI0023007B10|nr:uncharacterized protein BDF20DRAFT_860506 [Mycotypha africana]KAI8984550.1 hypothetical protein BDF20DRAFT_860506 [Mycotypha africana]
MQIRAMPSPTATTTSSFTKKSKWSSFITKLYPAHHPKQHRRQQQQEQQQNSSASMYPASIRRDSEETVVSQHNKYNRKHSDTMSVGTLDSTTSVADKVRHVLPSLFFRRTESSNHHHHQQQQQQPTMSTSSRVHSNMLDISRELEHLQSLYALAIEELNYAEDSRGSSYYAGDLVTAREALTNCTNAFLMLLDHMQDPLTREGLQTAMAAKLLKLQQRVDSLPEAEDY